jgi:ribosome biogenesis GTPase A
MAKALKKLKADLSRVNMVIELRDARIPISSSNPEFEALYEGKERITILTKKDYANPEQTNKWLEYFKAQEIEAHAINAANARDIKKVRSILTEKADKRRMDIKQRKGINRTIRAMVIGVPNVGKSTLINALAGRAKAKIEDRPGVTRNLQWVSITDFFEIMDTPGLLWPKLDGEKTGMYLAYTGAIRQDILNIEEIAFALLNELLPTYPESIAARYNTPYEGQATWDYVESICQNKGWLMRGAQPDTIRCATQIINDFKSASIDHITLETV